MNHPEALIRIGAAVVTLVFALLVASAGLKRTNHRFLALFLVLIGIVNLADYLGDHASEGQRLFWHWVADGIGALDPVVLYCFVATHPVANALWTRRRVALVGTVGLTLAILGIVTHGPPGDGTFRPLAWTSTLLISLFTATIYSLVLWLALRNVLNRPDERSWRPLFVGLAIVTLPVWFRTLSFGYTFLMVFLGLPPALPAPALLLALVHGGLAVGLILVAGRLARDATTRRLVMGGTAAAVVVGILLVTSGHFERLAGLQVTLADTIQSAGGAIKWLSFDALASMALLRDRMLDMSVAARRRAARVLVGLAAASAVALTAALLQWSLGAQPWAFRPAEWMLLGGAFLASQGFRTFVDHVANRIYGVPLPGDVASRHEAYRLATVQAIAEGRSPATDEGLQRLRRELEIEAPVALVLERMAESGSGAPLLAGALVQGRYRIVELTGRGGSGRVFLAHDELLQRDVVLKEVPEDDDDAKQGLREARLAGGLQHPNIVTIHDALERAGASLLVCEYAPGGSLSQRVARDGPLPAEEGVHLLEGVLEGLAAAHERGIIHRDLTPANVLLDARGVPKISDFGLAARTGTATLRPSPAGTPGYMAPEQREGLPTTAATDVYAAGILFQRCVQAGAPPAVQAVVERALQQDPAMRWQDARAMLIALRQASGRRETRIQVQ